MFTDSHSKLMQWRTHTIEKMRKILIFGVLTILLPELIIAARILAVFPTPSISHQVVFRPLVHELARRGHDVTVVTTDPAFPPGQAPGNLTEIDVHDLSYALWKEEFMTVAVGKRSDIAAQLAAALRVMLKIITKQIESKQIQDLIKKKKGEIDLLLLEAYLQPALIYSHFFKVPVILVSSFSGMKFNYRVVGASTHPLLYPTILHQNLYNLTTWKKLQQLYNHFYLERILWNIEQEADEVLKSIFGSDIPSIRELSNDVHMLFLNVNPIWVDNQPVPPNVLYIGGIHVTPRKELPEKIQSILDSSKNGVIYFSLGTNVRPSSLPPETIQMFIKVFSELPFDVLWKWDQDLLPGVTENIKIFKWLPQSDLLRHPKVKLFIAQGGLQSTDEAISAGVPLIGIPMLGDQWYNTQKYVHHRIGVVLDMTSLTEEELKRAIEQVTGDNSYRENVIKLRTLMTDQPQSPLERAVWWTEHVLRHGGARHLRARGANITWTEYLEFELILIVALTLISAATVISGSIFMVWKLTRQNRTNIKKKN